MSNQPLVSVLVTCFNGLPYIKKAIDCLLGQTYSNLEIVIIDDQSTDGTDIYLSTLASEKSNIYFFKNPVKGRGRALNFGLSKCKGTYIAINDADDYSKPERIEKQVRFLETHPEYGLVGSMSSLIALEDEKILEQSSHRPVEDTAIRRYFIKGQPIQHVTVMFRKQLALAIGGYNEKINFLFDRDIFLRFAKVSKLHNLNEDLVLVGEHRDRFFKYSYKGIDRSWMNTRYQIKAVFQFGFSPLYVLPLLLKFIYSIIIHIKQSIIKNEKS